MGLFPDVDEMSVRMKTEMSIPNPIYKRSQRLAQQLEMPLSVFFIAALKNYVELYPSDDVTRQLNEVYATEVSTLESEIIQLQTASIGHEQW
jgi:hypothetical protein